MRRLSAAWLPGSFTVALGVCAGADTLFVPQDFPNIQAAVNAATDGDEVVVADGLYAGPGNTDVQLLGKAITVRSADGAAHCTIDGEYEARAFRVQDDEGPDTIIEGFTVRRGFGSQEGGAIAIQDCSPTVRDCVFTECYGWNFGGGIGITGFDSAPSVERCAFANNYTDFLGGGISVDFGGAVTITDCVFSANIGLASGGGVWINHNATATILRCAFVGNMFSGIFVEPSAEAEVVNCLFGGNQGSGIYARSTLVVSNCTFGGNVGAAIGLQGTNFDAMVVNSILAGSVTSAGKPLGSEISGTTVNLTVNSSSVEGGWTGAGENNSEADPLFAVVATGAWSAAPAYFLDTNTTVFTDANASFAPNALVGRQLNPDTAQLRQQFIVANTGTTISVAGDFTDSSPRTGGPTNLVATAGDAYTVTDARPGAGSLVIDAGDNSAVPPGLRVDLDANPRLVDDPDVPDTGLGRAPLVDMGAYEHQPQPSPDLDGDGLVDGADLGMLFAAWNGPGADLNGDGTTDGADLGILLGAWMG